MKRTEGSAFMRVGFRKVLEDEGLANQLSHIAGSQPLHEVEAMNFDGLHANV